MDSLQFEKHFLEYENGLYIVCFVRNFVAEFQHQTSLNTRKSNYCRTLFLMKRLEYLNTKSPMLDYL